MNLSEQIAEDLKQAMKAKDKLRLSVLRMVRSAIKNQEINEGHTLSDEEVLNVFQKELKQRRDSLDAFKNANRDDLVEQTQQEIDILTEYLPAQLSEEELTALVAAVIQEIGAQTKADMGKVMGQVMPKIRGRADGKAAQQVVQRLLSE